MELVRVVDVNNSDDLEAGYNEWVDYWDNDVELVDEEYNQILNILTEDAKYVALPIYITVSEDSIDDEYRDNVLIHNLDGTHVTRTTIYVVNHKRYCNAI